jgi:hypothetical protein
MNVSFVEGHEGAKSILIQRHRVYSVITDNILMWICEI